MNIKIIAISTLALSVAAFAGSSHAADASAAVGGTVIAPITITQAADLAFGEFAPGVGGTVTVSMSGARTGTGVILSTIGSTPTAAKFDVAGEADATYSIAITPSATLSDGATNTMALATFSDLTGADATSGDVTAAGGTLTVGGVQSIYIGGTLTVGATQVAGNYTGVIDVTVEYN